MKKVILLSAAAALAASASAQYSCNPETSALLEKGTPSKVWYITLSEKSVADLEKAGSKLLYVGPDPEAGRNLWYWDQTFVPGSEIQPRVGMEDGGYISVDVSTVGWSGAGFAIDADPGVDLSGMNDDTRFHIAYTTNSVGPNSVAFVILDDEANGSKPAKVSVGKTSFDDNGAIYPRVAGEITDEWQGLDISFGDLKKLYPSFAPANLGKWGGNILSFLGGGVAGQNISLDAIYYYNMTDESGVEGVAADDVLVVTPNTVNANGVNGIQVYNAAGQLVAATEGCVLGIDKLAAGVYVAKAGNAVKKFVK